MKKFIYILILLLSANFIQAQEFSKFTPDQFNLDTNYGSFNFVSLTYYSGDNLTYPAEYEAAFADGYNSFELELGWQSTGRQEWQRLHKYPNYGLGVFTGSLGNSDVDSVLGTPSGIYFFYAEPLLRFWRISTYFDLGLGLSYGFNPYDAETNDILDVIGSQVNLYFNGSLYFMCRLTERFDMTVGANLFHFSNGRTNTPQRGVNLGGLNLGLKYNFNAIKPYTKAVRPDYQPAIRPTYIEAAKPPIDRYGEIQLTVSVGTVETEPGEAKAETGAQDTTGIQKRYTTSTISPEYAFLTTRILKLHAGLDFMYDGSLENFISDTPPQDVGFDGKFMLGYHFGFQYLIERFALYYSLGFYAYKETDTRGTWYMRAGGRIGLTENIDAHVALKTRNGGIADWIEWGLVYKLKVHN